MCGSILCRVSCFLSGLNDLWLRFIAFSCAAHCECSASALQQRRRQRKMHLGRGEKSGGRADNQKAINQLTFCPTTLPAALGAIMEAACVCQWKWSELNISLLAQRKREKSRSFYCKRPNLYETWSAFDLSEHYCTAENLVEFLLWKFRTSHERCATSCMVYYWISSRLLMVSGESNAFSLSKFKTSNHCCLFCRWALNCKYIELIFS